MDENELLVGPTSPEKKPNGISINQDAISAAIISTQSMDTSLSTGDLQLKSTGEEKQVNETIKSLTERLSAALLTINAKEELVKQHAKVAEEAVAGWEKAETEVTNLKQNLETVSRKNKSLESKIQNLDTALKECVRQLRQSRDDLKTQDSQIRESQIRLEELDVKLRVKEKECTDLKAEVELLRLERDLSNEVAENASRLNLENVKKVKKIEGECRRLRALNARGRIGILGESMSDGYSDVGLTDSETGQPDSSEVEMIRTGTVGTGTKNSLSAALVEIDLMDDFLEMERLAAETGQTGETGRGGFDKDEVEEMREKMESLGREKVELERLLEDSRSQAEYSESKLLEVEFQLDLVKESQLVCLKEIENLEANKNELELKLEKIEEERDLYKSNLEKIGADKLEYEGKIKALEKCNLAKLEEFRVEYEKKISLLEKSHLEKSGLLKEKIKEERAKSEEIRLKLDVQIKAFEDSMKKERAKSEEIKCKLEVQSKSLEENLKKERAKSEETKAKLESQIKSLEENMKKERAKSEETKAKLESKIKSLEKSHSDKLGVLEENLKNERAKLEEFTILLKNGETQLEMANLEVFDLKNNLRFLEGKIEKERQLSEEYETKCRKLEAQLERQQIVNSNGDINIKQEKEQVKAADKLAECQKTIASLGQQLKSLTNVDQEIITQDSDEESPNPNGELGLGLGLGLDSADDFAHDLIRFTRVNGNGQIQFSSPFLGFSRNNNNSHIEK